MTIPTAALAVTRAANNVTCFTPHSQETTVAGFSCFITSSSLYIVTQLLTFITCVTWVTNAGNLVCACLISCPCPLGGAMVTTFFTLFPNVRIRAVVTLRFVVSLVFPHLTGGMVPATVALWDLTPDT